MHTTAITTPSGPEPVADIDLTGLRAVVSGTSAGLGGRAALDLAGAGASVTIADAGTPRDAREFAAAWDGPLDILVTTADPGIAFEASHLGNFALAFELYDALAAARDEARIVSVCPGGPFAPLAFGEVRPARPLALGQLRTAAVLFAVAADDRWSGDWITANAADPGSALLAASPLAGDRGGQYFGAGIPEGHASDLAHEDADRLWDLSLDLIA